MYSDGSEYKFRSHFGSSQVSQSISADLAISLYSWSEIGSSIREETAQQAKEAVWMMKASHF
jgi:hypothetical protein